MLDKGRGSGVRSQEVGAPSTEIWEPRSESESRIRGGQFPVPENDKPKAENARLVAAAMLPPLGVAPNSRIFSGMCS